MIKCGKHTRLFCGPSLAPLNATSSPRLPWLSLSLPNIIWFQPLPEKLVHVRLHSTLYYTCHDASLCLLSFLRAEASPPLSTQGPKHSYLHTTSKWGGAGAVALKTHTHNCWRAWQGLHVTGRAGQLRSIHYQYFRAAIIEDTAPINTCFALLSQRVRDRGPYAPTLSFS